jgi:hypothetical protein
MKSLPRGRHERLQVSELQGRVAELEEELAGARTTEVSDDRVSNSRSRMKAFSPRRGRQLLLIGVR